MVGTHFSGNAIKIGVLEDFEKKKKKGFFGEKWWNYFLPVFKAPPKMGVIFWGAFLFFSFFLFLLHLARGRAKKTYFYRVSLHTLLKHLVTSCSNNQVKPKLPKKKVHNFFFGNPFFDQIFFKNTNFAQPPENCAPKI